MKKIPLPTFTSLRSCLVPVLLVLGWAQDFAQDRVALEPTRPPAQEQPQLGIYDVRDLLSSSHSNFPRKATEAERKQHDKRAYESLKKDLRKAIFPSTKDADWTAGLTGILAFHGTQQQHRAAARFLELQRRSLDLMYTLDCRWIMLPSSQAVELGFADGARFVSAEELKSLLSRVAKLTKSETLISPKVITQNGSRAEISVVEQMAYVAGYEEIYVDAPTPQLILDPLVKVVEDGMWMDLRARRSGEEHVTLDIEAKYQKVQQPLKVTHGANGDYSIPVVVSTSVKSVLQLKHGSTAILPAMLVDGQAVVVMVTADMVIRSELEQHAK